ncbi:MAG: flagellar hook-basal body protein [Clostridiales bacterium]|nr:flagellar hook-basal body protein [Clostridiales bacterium]MCF8021701.1 flagellar hook-basal body protein [Clostridiales bacterium]
MNRGFYTSISGLTSQMGSMKAVSNNIANAATCGYKRETAVVTPFHEMMLLNLKNTGGFSNVPSSPQKIGTINQGARLEDITVDFSPGTLTKTGRTLDLALAEDGFFRLVDDEGNNYYTRNGRFKLDSEGCICHSSGYCLTGESGKITVSSSDFTVSKDGTVSVNSEESGKLFIGRVDEKSSLQKKGDSLYTLPEKVDMSQAEKPVIKQGFIEESNAVPVKEITAAMKVLRAYGAGQKLVQAHDKLTEIAVQKVGSSK